MDNILEWLEEIDQLSEKSAELYTHLGMIIPTQLEGPAKVWYNQLSPQERTTAQLNWGTMRTAILNYFAMVKWVQDKQLKVIRMKYCQRGHEMRSQLTISIKN